MTVDQIIWLLTFIAVTAMSIFFLSGEKKQKGLSKIFSNPINQMFMGVVAIAVVCGIFIDNSTYRKGLGLAIVALLTAIFVELKMLFAPFFLTVCFVMAFPTLFE